MESPSPKKRQKTMHRSSEAESLAQMFESKGESGREVKSALSDEQAAKVIQTAWKRFTDNKKVRRLHDEAKLYSAAAKTANPTAEEIQERASQQSILIQQVPTELWEEVISYMGCLSTMGSIAQTCHLFNQICKINLVWQPVVQYVFPKVYRTIEFGCTCSSSSSSTSSSPSTTVKAASSSDAMQVDANEDNACGREEAGTNADEDNTWKGENEEENQDTDQKDHVNETQSNNSEQNVEKARKAEGEQEDEEGDDDDDEDDDDDDDDDDDEATPMAINAPGSQARDNNSAEVAKNNGDDDNKKEKKGVDDAKKEEDSKEDGNDDDDDDDDDDDMVANAVVLLADSDDDDDSDYDHMDEWIENVPAPKKIQVASPDDLNWLNLTKEKALKRKALKQIIVTISEKKSAANVFYGRKSFTAAILLYSDALGFAQEEEHSLFNYNDVIDDEIEIRYQHLLAILYSNLAQAELKSEDPNHAKAFMCCIRCNSKLNRIKVLLSINDEDSDNDDDVDDDDDDDDDDNDDKLQLSSKESTADDDANLEEEEQKKKELKPQLEQNKKKEEEEDKEEKEKKNNNKKKLLMTGKEIYNRKFKPLEQKNNLRMRAARREMASMPFRLAHYSPEEVEGLQQGTMLTHVDGAFGGGIFGRSKVLLTEFTATTVVGLIINKTLRRGTFIGGPCELSHVTTLHNNPDIPESKQIIAGVYQGGDNVAVEAMRSDDQYVVRDFHGYASWFPGQLEGEVLNGNGWTHTNTINADDVFDPDLVELRMG